MILGIGIDSIDIARLAPWVEYPQTQLLRIFHADELDYCFGSPAKTAERLAARFATREAFFKALSPHCSRPLPFLTACKIVSVHSQPSGAPELIVEWDYLSKNGHFTLEHPPKIHISLTHTTSLATAIVILEKL